MAEGAASAGRGTSNSSTISADSTLASRSRTATLGFSRPRSRRLSDEYTTTLGTSLDANGGSTFPRWPLYLLLNWPGCVFIPRRYPRCLPVLTKSDDTAHSPPKTTVQWQNFCPARSAAETAPRREWPLCGYDWSLVLALLGARRRRNAQDSVPPTKLQRELPLSRLRMFTPMTAAHSTTGRSR
jgi:hypothetical protein